MNTVDTIAAPASAVGGAVTVIRISGPEALTVLKMYGPAKAILKKRAITEKCFWAM